MLYFFGRSLPRDPIAPMPKSRNDFPPQTPPPSSEKETRRAIPLSTELNDSSWDSDESLFNEGPDTETELRSLSEPALFEGVPETQASTRKTKGLQEIKKAEPAKKVPQRGPRTITPAEESYTRRIIKKVSPEEKELEERIRLARVQEELNEAKWESEAPPQKKKQLSKDDQAAIDRLSALSNLIAKEKSRKVKPSTESVQPPQAEKPAAGAKQKTYVRKAPIQKGPRVEGPTPDTELRRQKDMYRIDQETLDQDFDLTKAEQNQINEARGKTYDQVRDSEGLTAQRRLDLIAAGSKDRMFNADILQSLTAKEMRLQRQLRDAKEAKNNAEVTSLQIQLDEISKTINDLEKNLFQESDEKREKRMARAVDAEVGRLYPELRDQDLDATLKPEIAQQVRREAQRSLRAKLEPQLLADQPKSPSSISQEDKELFESLPSKEQAATPRKKGTSAQNLRDRRQEIELTMLGMKEKRVDDSKKIEALRSELQGNKEKLQEASADEWFESDPYAKDKLTKLSTEDQGVSDIYSTRKQMEEARDTAKDDIIKAGAEARLRKVNKQIEEAEETLEGRELAIGSISSDRPARMSSAEQIHIGVSRDRSAQYAREEAERKSSPFAATENLLSGAITESLIKKDEYVPGVLRKKQAELAAEAAMGGPQAKRAEQLVQKIDSALKNIDYDRWTEAYGALKTRYDQTAEQYRNAIGTDTEAVLQGQMNNYKAMIREAESDKADVFSREIENRTTALARDYGVKEEDVTRMRTEKISFFSSPNLWRKQRKMRQALDAINQLEQQKNKK